MILTHVKKLHFIRSDSRTFLLGGLHLKARIRTGELTELPFTRKESSHCSLTSEGHILTTVVRFELTRNPENRALVSRLRHNDHSFVAELFCGDTLLMGTGSRPFPRVESSELPERGVIEVNITLESDRENPEFAF